MKATVAFVVVWYLLVSSSPAAALEPIETRSIVSEQVGLLAASDGTPLSSRTYAIAQTPSSRGGISNWKVLVVVAVAVVVVVLAVRATSGNTAYQRPVE
jgi:hypothetical protein